MIRFDSLAGPLSPGAPTRSSQTPLAAFFRLFNPILFMVGEIIGGSQREDDLEKLSARAKEMHLPEESISWYLDLR